MNSSRNKMHRWKPDGCLCCLISDSTTAHLALSFRFLALEASPKLSRKRSVSLSECFQKRYAVLHVSAATVPCVFWVQILLPLQSSASQFLDPARCSWSSFCVCSACTRCYGLTCCNQDGRRQSARRSYVCVLQGWIRLRMHL